MLTITVGALGTLPPATHTEAVFAILKQENCQLVIPTLVQ